MFSSAFADLLMEASSVMAPRGHTSFVTQRTVLPTLLITELNSVLNITADSSEAGTTPGDHTLELTVRVKAPSFSVTQRKN